MSGCFWVFDSDLGVWVIKKPNMMKINLHLSIPQREFFEAVSKKNGLSIAENMRRALDKYIDSRDLLGKLRGRDD